MKTMSQIFADITQSNSPEQQKQDRKRVEQQMLIGGATRAEAEAVDKAFRDALHDCGQALGKAMDTLPPEDLAKGAINYIMRGVLSNLDQIEDLFIQEQANMAARDGAVVMVVGGRPDCNCPSCANARRVSATRH